MMKKMFQQFWTIVLVVCLVVGAIPTMIEKVNAEEIENNKMEYEESEAWDGTSIQEPQLIGYEYKISTASELAWFANEVNNNNNNFDGKSIYISGNIDLNKKEWPAIGNSKSGDAIEIKGDIVIKDAIISGLQFSQNNSKNKGLFGTVKISKVLIDNLTMNNANFSCTNGYDGVLFGKLFLARNSVCEIINSTISGCFTGMSQCGTVAGDVEGEGTNSTLSITNCNLGIEANTYGTMWDGSKYNGYSKGGAIGRYYSNSSNSRLILNGVCNNVNIASYNEYGYGSCVVGGMVGELEGSVDVYIYQCAVKGTITSSGYSGFAGGLIGKMISCDIYKQLDSYVTATIYSRFNSYGYQYNAGGFVEGPMSKKPEGYIKNSYFAGASNTATAFIAKDCVGGDKLKIYNSYYDSSILGNKVYHADNRCYTIDNTVVDCQSYNTSQMGIKSNFVGWNFDDIWVMGDKYPELRRKNFTLPEDFLSTTNEDLESSIVKTVREYASQEIYSQWKEIWESDYSEEVKFNKILELASNYGITDPREGLEFVITSSEKRWAYNMLISDELYTASNFLTWLDDGGRTLLVADGLIFNSEINKWLSVETYLQDDYPGISKYKDMLYEYMDSASKKIEVLEEVKLVTDLSKKVTDISTKNYVDKKIQELQNINYGGLKGEIERKKIFDEMVAKGVFIDIEVDSEDVWNPKFSYKLDSTSGFGKYAKAMGIASDSLELVEMAIEDIRDMVLLDSKLQTYYQFDEFLNDIIQAGDQIPIQLRIAAKQVKEEIDKGYWVFIDKITKQFFKAAKIDKMVKDTVLESLGATSVGGFLSSVDIEVWFINKVVDVGTMVKQASKVEGYAYLERLYKTRLENSRTKFLNRMTEKNAWDFYYDYNMLYSLRYKGEEAYLKMNDVEGIAKIFFQHGYSKKEEATQKILDMLEKNCKFDLGEDVEIPESMKFISKVIVSCPVNVKVYNQDEQLISELKDGQLQDISNEYGRFVCVYNYCTGDYSKVIYFNDPNLKIEVVSNDDGLVNMTYSYMQQSNKATVKYVNNLPLEKNDRINIDPDEVMQNGKVSILSNNENIELEIENEQSSYVNVDKAELSDENVLLYIGESKLLNILVEPQDATVQDVIWCSSAPEIVTVRDGKITAVKEGDAIIYAFMHDRKKPLKCNVSSKKIPDATEPKVQISVGTNRWDEFRGIVEYDRFYKQSKEVNILPIAEEIKSSWYYISNRALSADEVKSDDISWTRYIEKFQLSANSKQIIYVKAIDERGNIFYANSSGLVIYTDSTQDTREVTYIKTVTGDVTANVCLNGNTISEVKNGDIILKINEDYVVNESGRIVFKTSYLDTLPANETPYKIVITYNPLGEHYIHSGDNDNPTTTEISLIVKNCNCITDDNLHEFEYEYIWKEDYKKCEATRKCKSCGLVETEIVDTVATITQPSSCIMPELTEYVATFTNLDKGFVQQRTGGIKTAEARGHVSSDWIVDKKETAKKEGSKHKECIVCGEILEVSIIKAKSTVNKNIHDVELNAGLKIGWKGNSIVVKWGKVEGAQGYDIFVEQCEKEITNKSLNNTVNGKKTSATIKKVGKKNISNQLSYEIMIKAYQKVGRKKVYIGTSLIYHVVGKSNKKYTNAKKIKLEKKVITLKVKKSSKIKAKIIKESNKKKLLDRKHGAPLRYYVSDSSIVKVTTDGKIIAKKKGRCYVYVTTLNGVSAKVEVIVK